MDTKIREHINKIFQDGPKTKKALEMKEEMIANAEEKYKDLIAEGYQEEDAFDVVINSIGNVKELFREFEEDDLRIFGYTEQEKALIRKKARVIAISVGIYIFAVLVYLFFEMIRTPYAFDRLIYYTDLGLLIAGMICIIPTAMLVHLFIVTPKYRKKEENMVEEYKEWKYDKKRNKDIRIAISCIIWSITITSFLAISILFHVWYISWVILLIGICIEAIVKIIFTLKKP